MKKNIFRLKLMSFICLFISLVTSAAYAVNFKLYHVGNTNYGITLVFPDGRQMLLERGGYRTISFPECPDDDTGGRYNVEVAAVEAIYGNGAHSRISLPPGTTLLTQGLYSYAPDARIELSLHINLDALDFMKIREELYSAHCADGCKDVVDIIIHLAFERPPLEPMDAFQVLATSDRNSVELIHPSKIVKWQHDVKVQKAQDAERLRLKLIQDEKDRIQAEKDQKMQDDCVVM